MADKVISQSGWAYYVTYPYYWMKGLLSRQANHEYASTRLRSIQENDAIENMPGLNELQKRAPLGACNIVLYGGGETCFSKINEDNCTREINKGIEEKRYVWGFWREGGSC